MFFGLFTNKNRRNQRWQVSYTATVKTTSPFEGKLVLPLPRNTEYQKLDGAPTFSVAPKSIAVEPMHNNSFAYWDLQLAAGESMTIAQNFVIEKLYINSEIRETLTTADYTSDEAKKYLTDNHFIASGDPKIKDAAQSILSTQKTVAGIIRACNEYVMLVLKYGNPIPGLYSAADALTKLQVDCGGYDTLLISLLIACGVPARIVSGFWLGYPQNDMHAWVAILLPDGSWIPADPSVEQLVRLGRSKKIGKLGEVGSDRLVTSFGCDFTLDLGGEKIQTDILQNPILHPVQPDAEATVTVTAKQV